MFNHECFLDREDVIEAKSSGTVVAQTNRIPVNSILQTLVAFHRKLLL
jgi:hypothetical protein